MGGDGLKKKREREGEEWISAEENIFCAFFRGIINFQRRKRASSPHRGDTASEGGFSTMDFELLVRANAF